ncbi:Hypp5408 [Branchiostoma lanceolatum]|uniref:Hypp5408 protein n=1 Tax=Branchiostoma lanceolatum TaxID=7740 RepID=A0A8K0F428_BRALA|nr:Hypp5408 [Branchiostoma lanceolatum]
MEFVESGASDESNQVQKKRRKDKTTVSLTEEEEQDLIEWVRDHPKLYKKRLKGYKNVQREEATWQEKASEIGKTSEHLKTWYRSMRTRMSEQGNEELTARDAWVKTNMSFLQIHIAAVQKRPLQTIVPTSTLATYDIAIADDVIITTKTPNTETSPSLSQAVE